MTSHHAFINQLKWGHKLPWSEEHAEVLSLRRHLNAQMSSKAPNVFWTSLAHAYVLDQFSEYNLVSTWRGPRRHLPVHVFEGKIALAG